MESLKIDTGVKEFRINDAVTIKLNPSDTALAKRLFVLFEKFDKNTTNYKDKIAKASESAEIFTLADNLDKEMREDLNGIFNMDICTPLFGDTSCYAIANGMPIWANILFAFLDLMDEAVKKEQTISKERIKKYTDKYMPRKKK